MRIAPATSPTAGKGASGTSRTAAISNNAIRRRLRRLLPPGMWLA